MDIESKYTKIVRKFEDILRIYDEIYRRPRDFGTGDLLFSAEMNVVLAIGEESSDNITEIANRLRVSKSAVSQIVNKLEKKKYIKRYKTSDNNKEVLLKLLDKGVIALEEHRSYHATLDAPLIRRMQTWTPEQYEFFNSILDEIKSYLEITLKERM
jgi:DNA-binding MarR family transcriptional regulator